MAFKSKDKKMSKSTLIIMIFIISGILLTVLLWLQGIFIPNNSSTKYYSVKGVDFLAVHRPRTVRWIQWRRKIYGNVFNGSDNEFKEYGY